jgi:hypothetical protein
MDEKEEEMVGKYTQLIFECTVCKKVYKKSGMCNTCDVTLKPKGG